MVRRHWIDVELQIFKVAPVRYINSYPKTSRHTTEGKPGGNNSLGHSRQDDKVPKELSSDLGAGSSDKQRQAGELASTTRELCTPGKDWRLQSLGWQKPELHSKAVLLKH